MIDAMFSGNTAGLWMVFLLLAMAFSAYAQMKVTSSYKRFSRQSSGTGYTGAQIARIILDKNGLQHVRVEPVAGTLTDHYDPRSKVLRLSEGIYNGSSVASMSVAAHEVGHAIQDDVGYYMLVLRNNMVPIVNFSSRFVWIFIFLGMAISNVFIDIGILLFLGVLFFHIVTLPVELDASKRALEELKNGIAPAETIRPARSMLSAAALTYIGSMMVALAELFRLLSIRDRRNR